MARLSDDRLDDLVQDVQTALAALFKGLGDDVVGQAVDLDVHLDGGDALAGAADLEVHVAVEVLDALNVQHGHPAVALGDEAAGDAGDRSLDGHTGVHQRQRGTADGSLRGGAVGTQDLGHAADGVGELLQRGQHRHKGALGQCAVADLAAAGAAGCAGLADRVRREVVVVNVALGLLIGQVIHELVVLGAAQGAGGQHLGLAAGEHAGAMDTGQDAHFCGQRADLVDAAAIHALALIEQPAADDVLLHLVADEVEVCIAQVGVLCGDLVQDEQQRGIADVLVVGVHRSLEVVQILLLDGMEDVHIQAHDLEVDLRLAALGHDLVDERDGLLDLHMRRLDGVQHGVFIDLVGTGFDHDDLVHGGSHGQGQVALFALLLGRVQDDLTVHQADLNAADGAVPGDLRHSGDEGCADHTGDLRAAVRVQAHDGHGDADIVAHLLGEQRAHGAVHNTAGEDGALTRAALAAHEAAGDAACGVELLLILDIQGEEIHTFAGLGAHDHVAHHAGLAVADEGACVGQAAHLAHLDLEGPASQRRLVDLEVLKGLFAGTKFDCHLVCLLCPFSGFYLPKGCPPRIIAINPAPVQTAPKGGHRRSIYCCNTQQRPFVPQKSKGQAPQLRYLPSVFYYLRRPRVAIRAR